MRTLRLADPFPRGMPQKKLEWGSSDWAADSCLVEWSTLEREWLAPQPRKPQAAPVWIPRWRDVPTGVWPWLAALAALTLLYWL